MFAALAVGLAAFSVGFTGLLGHTGFTGLTRVVNDLAVRSERSISKSPVREAPAATPVASTAPPLVAVASKEPPITRDAPQASPPPKAPATEPAPLAQAASSVARAPEQPASASSVPAQEPPRAVQATAAQVPEQQRGGTARVVVAVSPGGEIYIDDKHYGTTPPITTLDLNPGMHRIEVRSGSRKPYLTYMTVQAGDVRRIRHDFDAKPSRPPG
jgi:hypothetical protein